MQAEPVRILVVDDSTADFDLARELFDMAPGSWTLGHAGDWEAGRTELLAGGWDASLVDYRLGGRDGLELVEAVLAQGCRIPMVLLTGAGGEGLDRAALAAGAADYLDKGALTPELLATTVQRAIARQSFQDSTRRGAIDLDGGDGPLGLASCLVDGLVVCSPDGVVLHATPGAEVLFGKSLRDLRGFCLGPVQDGQSADIDIPDLGSERRHVSIRCAGVRWEGRPAVVVSLSDRSRQALAEARLSRAQKMETVGRFAGGIGHDLNNLMQGAITHLELSRRTDCCEPSCRSFVDLAAAMVDRAAHVARRLQSFAMQRHAHPEAIDLGARVAQMEPLLRQVVGRDAGLDVEVLDAGLVVCVDPVELEQILINLVTNAIEAAGPAGKVRVRVSRQRIASVLQESSAFLPPPAPGAFAAIEVDDNGPGLAGAEIPLIFEPFYSSRGVGTSRGLGLTIVDGIVRQRGGFISVRTSPGGGATFRIGLPVSPGVSEHDSGQTDLPEEESPMRGTVLLVDDEPTVRSALQSALECAGHEVLAGESGEAALRLLARASPRLDILVTDILMPGMDGFELADLVRREVPDLPVLFITGYDRDLLSRRGGPGSHVEILQKPFRMAALISRVDRLMQARKTPGSPGGLAEATRSDEPRAIPRLPSTPSAARDRREREP